MYFCPSPFTCWKYTFELLVTGMLCHSKVWSRVWTHRCNVNMNPYISVCPFSVFHILLDLFPQSVLAVYQPSSFIFVLLSSQAVRWALLKGGCVASLCSVELSASICLDLPPSPCPPLIFAPSSLSLYRLRSFWSLHFCIARSLAVFRGHWDVWEELYLLFIPCSLWSKWARIGYPERFIASVAWCFTARFTIHTLC